MEALRTGADPHSYGGTAVATNGAAGLPPGFETYLHAPAAEAAFNHKPPMHRRRWNSQALLMSVLLPWVIYVGVSAAMSFPMPETGALSSGQLCVFACLCALGVVLVFGVLAFFSWTRPVRFGTPEPTWFSFLFVTSLLAWVLGLLSGWANWETNLAPYYFITSLRYYDNVDVNAARGLQLMDAGRLTFVPGTQVDISKSMGFRQKDMYCVAPVVPSPGTNLVRYDFWAVGINCCSDHAADFHCGDYSNQRARSGIRLFHDEELPWFKLALQQAEATHRIRSEHPVFLTWLEDPSAGVNEDLTSSLQWYFTGITAYLVFQVLLVIGAMGTLWSWGW